MIVIFIPKTQFQTPFYTHSYTQRKPLNPCDFYTLKLLIFVSIYNGQTLDEQGRNKLGD
jgi:hypothetical protein